MGSTIKQRLRRFNGTDYDTIHLETEKSCITDFPTSMPASDVYDWAKAASKPSYSTSELSNWPSGGTDGQVLGLNGSNLAWLTAGKGNGTCSVEIDMVNIAFGSNYNITAVGRYIDKPNYVTFIDACLSTENNGRLFQSLTITPNISTSSSSPSFYGIMVNGSTASSFNIGHVGWRSGTSSGNHQLTYQKGSADSGNHTFYIISVYTS